MKKIYLIFAILLLPLAVMVSVPLAANSVITQTLTSPPQTDLNILTFTWTASTTSAGVSATPTSSEISAAIAGSYLIMAKTVSGATPYIPTDEYDIAVTDQYGYDILGGALENSGVTATLLKSGVTRFGMAVPLAQSNIANSGVTRIAIAAPVDASGVTLEVTGNSVVSAKGTVILYFSRQR